jgi:hypothetical protein
MMANTEMVGAQNSPRSSVTDQERQIVEQMIGTLNAESSWSITLTDFYRTLRVIVSRFIADPTLTRVALRRDVLNLLGRLPGLGGEPPPDLPAPQQALVRAILNDGGARLHFSFDRRGFRVEAIPVLRYQDAELGYGLALLLDSRRGFGRGLQQCVAPQRERITKATASEVAYRRAVHRSIAETIQAANAPGYVPTPDGIVSVPLRLEPVTPEKWSDVPRCGRFFWRRHRRQRYCSDRCQGLAALEKNWIRVRRFRRQARARVRS